MIDFILPKNNMLSLVKNEICKLILPINKLEKLYKSPIEMLWIYNNNRYVFCTEIKPYGSFFTLAILSIDNDGFK
jgi:hypothetical protein